MPLTRRGQLLAAGAVALAAGGRVLGVIELFVLAAGAGGLVVVVLLALLFRRPGLETSRYVHPPRVHAGTESQVELVTTNRGPRATPVFVMQDPFEGPVRPPGSDHQDFPAPPSGGRRRARFLLAPVAPGTTVRARYGLPVDHRGLYRLGPLELRQTDPFGLAVRTRRTAPAVDVTVYPRVEPLAPLPHAGGQDLRTTVDRPNTLNPAGDDFYGLREYQVGDDLRRVHWPSSARLDELMIRQQELPREGRATVLLDTRRRRHDRASFELLVSAAASILLACSRDGSLIRLVTSSGLDSGLSGGRGHLENVLEHLAVVGPGADDRLDGVLDLLRAVGNTGALAALVTADAADEELEGVAWLQSRFGSVTMVVVDRSTYEPGAPGLARRHLPAVDRLIPVAAATELPGAWNRAMTGRGRAHPARKRRAGAVG